MKEGWKIKKLGEICDSINGLWKGKKGPFVTVGVLRSTNFTKDCRLNLTNVIYLEVEEKTFEKRKLREGDIIVERSGGGPNQPVGRAVLFKEITGNFSFCNFTSVLRIKETTQLIPKYLHKYLAYFYLSGGTTEMQSYTIGLRNLDYNRYLQIDIPIPSKKEQLRIIEILDAEFAKIDALRANVTKSLQAAKDLFQSALKQEFNTHKWELSSIGTECKTGAGGTPNKMYKEYYENGNIPWLRSGEVCTRNIYATEKFITQAGMENSSAKWFPSNTVVVAMYGATAGQVGILRIPSTTNQAICGIFPNEKYLPDFLYYVLLSQKDTLVAQATGNAQANISQIKIKNITIPIISLAEQTRIVSRLDQLNERCKTLQENYDRTITLCEDLKQALLRKAFNGEL
ncbi:restriction endonuclease subunit S [uncultured Barnesiella sp.]|uniref:restriction endonuclease subunit S n=1 Tax=uncultured Barnesiella sp. TaxID=584861 RepID=UPI002631CA0E|nr:restriction endonuclease subunit S [uncultured Barnesiella sp.]